MLTNKTFQKPWLLAEKIVSTKVRHSSNGGRGFTLLFIGFRLNSQFSKDFVAVFGHVLG